MTNVNDLENMLTAKMNENYELTNEVEKLKFHCESLLDACEYYLPILEERLSCGFYMRQKINFYKSKTNKL